MKKLYSLEEGRCEYSFRESGPYWHLCTPENYPVFFTDAEDFKAGMILLAICALSYPSIRILTFQWMNNHLHIVLSGKEEDIAGMFRMLKKYLGSYLKSRDRAGILDAWSFKKKGVDSLGYMRNVIAYNNRNGFLVKDEFSPYSYPWGANKCFFNTDYAIRYAESRKVLRSQMVRELYHTRDLDSFGGMKMLDGYVCPFEFCDIALAEAMFRNASQYFYTVSKSVEGMKDIAKEIGENVFYNDEELFAIVCRICRDQYDVKKPSLLPVAAKIEVARVMHFEYNAGAKQIQRMLKVDESLISAFAH